MRQGLLAGIVTKTRFEQIEQRANVGSAWTTESDGQFCFLSCDEPNSSQFEFDQIVVLVRGYAILPGETDAAPHSSVAKHVVEQYKSNSTLRPTNCEGNFSIVLLDGNQSRLLAYRNISNNRFTYIAEEESGTLIGSNLAIVSKCLRNGVTPNESQLPTFFLFRFSPARETLVKDVTRLLAGQSLRVEDGKPSVRQEQTLADLTQPFTCTNEEAIARTGELFDQIHKDIASVDPAATTLLSGGVDSCTLHAHWMKHAQIPDGQADSISITTDAPETQGDTQYALSASKHFGTNHDTVCTNAPYPGYLVAGIESMGEPPNHVQGVFYRQLAKEMFEKGMTTGLNGEGADCLFGTPTTDLINRARRIRSFVPVSFARSGLGKVAAAAGKQYWYQSFELANFFNNLSNRAHPVNLGSLWSNVESVDACFGREAVDAAFAQRRELLTQYNVKSDPLNQYHEQTMLGEVADSATLWTGVFHEQGVDMICPFLDSRLIRFVLSMPPELRFQEREPKKVLKDALLKHMPRDMVFRKKLAFGQPIFKWMQTGGELRPMIDAINIDDHPFLSAEVLAAEKAKPTWFLFSLLCYDLWNRQFVKGTPIAV